MSLLVCLFAAVTTAQAGSEPVLIRLGGEVVQNPRPVPATWNPLHDPAGTPISMDVEKAELRQVLRHIQDVSGLNFVLMDGVKGDITVVVRKSAWTQVLGAVLETHDLAAMPMGPGSNIILIGPAAELQEC